MPAVASPTSSRPAAPAKRVTARQVLAALRKRDLTVAVAESCTGGLVLAGLTSVPGSSAVVCGGIVAYADDVKTGLLGVPARTLSEHGAVSRQCAAAMAQGVRRKLRADIGVAVTGIAGPGGGVAGKPVGTVWIAVSSAAGEEAQLHHFAGSRAAVRRQSVQAALALLVQSLP